jgi:hypothetical protein
MIEEGKLLKMIYSVLHDSLLATATCNSTSSSDNSTTISRTTTDTVDTTSTATTAGDQKQSKRSPESQSQGDLKRQRTYEPENEITKPPDLTDLNHQQQKSPDTDNTETQQGGHTHHIPQEPSATMGERQITLARDTERTPNLPVSPLSPIQRPHPRETIRTMVTGARRHSLQFKKRRMCTPPRNSGPSCEPLTVSKTELQRRTM